jgi:two-component system phosphate regulon response regulator PhoB
MPRESILVVDDEEDIQELVRYNLAKEGYQVECAGSGEDGIKNARAKNPNLIVLDLMLPGVDGLDVCRVLKSDPSTRAIPVIILTAKGEEADIVAGLEIGADDYLVKPFSPRVLAARVKAVFRRNRTTAKDDQALLTFEGLELDPRKHELRIDGAPTDLTVSEFKLLHFLARQEGWVFTRSQLVDAVHGADYAVTERSIDVVVVGLRRKMGATGKLIETVRGVGYRFRGS